MGGAPTSGVGSGVGALAASLAPELIDPVYNEVYRSLRMQLELDEEAACRIRAVRVLELETERVGDFLHRCRGRLTIELHVAAK